MRCGSNNLSQPSNLTLRGDRMKGHRSESKMGSPAYGPSNNPSKSSDATDNRTQHHAGVLDIPGLGWKVSRGLVTRWVFGLLVLAAPILVVLRFSDLAELTALTPSARPEWLLLALLAQVGTYLCAGSVLRVALKEAGRRIRLRSLAKLGLVKLFADQAIPSVGLSGTILLVRAGATIFAAVAVAIPVALLWLRRVGRTSPPIWTKRFPKTAYLLHAMVLARSDLLLDRSLMAKATLLQTGVFLLDSLTLWFSFQALGSAPALWACFVAFVVASAAATIGPIPLGLGTLKQHAWQFCTYWAYLLLVGLPQRFCCDFLLFGCR
jgi:uncharacterized membrane protein YbhN (UPF0104 family)